MGKTYQELKQSLGDLYGIPELYWWIAYHHIEPFDPGHWRQTGRLCAAMFAAQGHKVSEDDFIPARPQVQTDQSKINLLKGMGLKAKHKTK